MRVKRMMAALLAALLAMHMGAALGEQTIRVYVSAGSMGEPQRALLEQLFEWAADGVSIEVIDGETAGGTLRDRVLADNAPDLAICRAQEAALYAAEGLLLPLDTAVLGGGIAQAVAAACTLEEQVYMAPLIAQHRQMAVSRSALLDMQLAYLLDTKNHPVWLPMQLGQVLEEAALCERTGMELWPLTGENCEGVFALAQALYGGLFVTEDGREVTADSESAAAGAAWLQGMAECGLIGMAKSREQALERFLAGESVLFADWTPAESRKYAGRMQEFLLVPYPSASALPVRAFELTGVVAFAGKDEQKNALCRALAVYLVTDMQAERAFNPRGTEDDGAQWIVPPGLCAHTGALRGALCTALNAMLEGRMEAEAALRGARAACGL